MTDRTDFFDDEYESQDSVTPLDVENLAGLISAGGAMDSLTENFEQRDSQIKLLKGICHAFNEDKTKKILIAFTIITCISLPAFAIDEDYEDIDYEEINKDIKENNLSFLDALKFQLKQTDLKKLNIKFLKVQLLKEE